MIPWIQVYSNLPQHPKTSRLADELGLASAALNPNVLAVGLLVSLWTWAIQNAYNGDLSSCSARSIAEACLWKKKPETLVNALIKTGFLDPDMKLHDWDEYACLLMEQEENRRAKTRERVKRYRDKKNGVTDTPCNAPGNGGCNVTDTPCNAPTRPDLTRPNLTRQDQIFNFSGGGEARAQAREEVSQFCQERNLEPSIYFGMTAEIRGSVQAFTQAIFDRFATRQPTEIDEAQVFQSIYESHRDDLGTWHMDLNADRKELLLYACEAASKAGKPGDWNYINGVLGRLARRSVRTLDDAEEYDYNRDQGRN